MENAAPPDAAWERRFSPPVELNCPITRTLMSSPVLAGDGYTYERAAIAYWFESRATSPVTNAEMTSRVLKPNLTVLTMTNTYKQQVSQELRRLAEVLAEGGVVAYREMQDVVHGGKLGGGSAGNDKRSDLQEDLESESEEEEEERWHTTLTYRRFTFLLDHGADPNTRDAEGNSVLLCCTRAGRADLVALLIGAGADVTRANDAGEHADVVALARKLPPAQAASMVAVLLPAVQTALEKQRRAATRRGSASGGSSDTVQRWGRGEDDPDGGGEGGDASGPELAGAEGEGRDRNGEEEAAAPLLPGFPTQVQQWDIRAGTGFFPSLFALQFRGFMSRGTHPRLPTRAEAWLDGALGKYTYWVVFASLVLLWIL